MRLLLSLCLLFFGCTKSNETRLLLDWLPNPNHIPLYVGKELGLFEKEGIHLTILKSSDNASNLGHLSFDQVDLVVTYMPSFAKAEIQGNKARIVGKLIGKPLDGVLFHQDGTIHCPKDLSGKVFGYAYDSTSSNLKYLLKINDIHPEKTLHCSFDLVGMMLTRQVDAVYGAYYTIEGEHLADKGLPVGFFTLEELGYPTYYELIIAANQEHPRFAKALQLSIDYCKSNPEKAFEIYKQLFPEKSTETLYWEKKAWDKTVPLLAEDQVIDEQLYSKLKDWFLAHT